MVSSLANRRRLRSLHLQYPKVRGKAVELKVRRKLVANSNKNLEQDVEDSFQLLQVIQKQMENLKKSITNQESKSISDYEAVISPIKAHYAKNEC